jgi:GlpG protein
MSRRLGEPCPGGDKFAQPRCSPLLATPDDSMRQLGTLPDAQTARILADYLRAQSVETRVDRESAGWVVWVCDEDKLTQARQEYQTFLKDPTDERYVQARQTAKELRKEEARQERTYRRRQERFDRKMFRGHGRQLTMSLVVVSFLVTLLFHAREQRELVGRYLFITDLMLPKDVVDEQLPDVYRGEIWRAVTPIFIHFGVFHLLFNMLWLLHLGPQIESRYGPGRLALLVLLIAVLSNLAQYHLSGVSVDWPQLLIKPPNPNFGGMSGVVFGLFGYVWMKSVYEPGCGLFVGGRTILLMVFWLVLCMTPYLGLNIANTAHLVGLGVGMVVGYLSARWNNFGQRGGEESE